MPEILLHLLTPHHTNNHRARVLHLDALLFYVMAFAVFHVGIQWLHRSHPDILGFATDIRLDQLLADTNTKRTAAGLGTLKLNDTLSAAAAEKAKDMFAKNYWAHFSPDSKTPWDFITGAGYRYAIAGENLAKNFSTSQAVVDAWMASPTHRDNLLKPQYRDIGFAIVNGTLNGEETTLVVQMFGTTGSDLAQEAPKPIAVPAIAAEAPQTAVIESPGGGALLSFASSIWRPLVDVSAVTRTVTFLFVGFLLGVLAVDFWLVRQRRLVRLTGHTLGHLVFLGSILLVTEIMARGSIL
ncbi:hypothetical protein HY086_01865 [Candidatus Gottesmanbacteria bacterium]|nr:hypothetical protein [Candidatus Gottesmanbacteria bacterium]